MKILINILNGKSNIQEEMVAFNFSINRVKNTNEEIEMLFLDQAVQALNRKQANLKQIKEQIDKVKEVRINIKTFSVILKIKD
ncbi:MAG: hypothetical protein RXP30_00085 [Thermoplasmata archaeon]|nr:hypothetical protein [Euryarchaeota archaeon]MVT35805.1 hypothetical protein [Euryarchaeota archaeon]